MKKLMVVLIGWLVYTGIQAQSDFKILCGPYLQMVGENEATVMWITSKDAVSWVEVAPDDSSHFYAEERPRFFQTNFGKKMIGTLHAVRLKRLEKGTTYRYRIFSQEVTQQTPYYIQYGKVAASNVYSAKPYRFSTLDEAKDAVSFVVVNDIHADDALLSSLLKELDKEKTDFVLFNGDMVSSMDSQQQLLDGFMSRCVQLFANEIPFFYARGNHETRGLFSTQYIRYFPTSTGQPYYAFRHGPVFFVVLDGGEDKPDSDIEYYGLAAFDQYRKDEIAWLKEVLQSEAFRNAPFKVAVMHVPPIRSTWHGPIEVKKHFIPLLNQAGIDLMLCAHLHTHQYIPAGREDCHFPILINSNQHVCHIHATASSLTVQIRDRQHKPVKELNFQHN